MLIVQGKEGRLLELTVGKIRMRHADVAFQCEYEWEMEELKREWGKQS